MSKIVVYEIRKEVKYSKHRSSFKQVTKSNFFKNLKSDFYNDRTDLTSYGVKKQIKQAIELITTKGARCFVNGYSYRIRRGIARWLDNVN